MFSLTTGIRRGLLPQMGGAASCRWAHSSTAGMYSRNNSEKNSVSEPVGVVEQMSIAMDNIRKTKETLTSIKAAMNGRALDKEEKVEENCDSDSMMRFKFVVKGLDLEVTHSYAEFIRRTAVECGFKAAKGVTPLKMKVTKLTLLKSPHVYKTARSQYEKRVYGRAVKVYDADPEVGERFIEYLRTKYPAGTGASVELYKYEEIPKSILKLLPNGPKTE